MIANNGRVSDPTAAQTFPQLVRAAAAAYGHDMTITLHSDAIADEAVSFVELERRSSQLARGMIARGVGKGCWFSANCSAMTMSRG